MITASGLEAAIHCPASAVLPRAYSTSAWAEDGIARHEFLRRVLPPSSLPYEEAIEFVPKDLRSQCAAIGLAGLDDLMGDCRKTARAEVAYAYNVDTGVVRELGVAISRQYAKHLGVRTSAKAERWICGTLDLEGGSFDGSWTVKDWKSGHGDVTHAKENPQVKFFGVVLGKSKPNVSKVRSAIVRLHDDGRVEHESRATYTALELDTFADTMGEAVEAVAKARRHLQVHKTVDVVEGPWCRYCPAFASCPAKQALVRAMVPELDAIGNRIAEMTVDEAGKAWATYKRIKRIFETVERALKDRALLEPIPLPSGKWARPVEFERTSFDAAAAVALLRIKGASAEEVDALRVRGKVTQIREVNRPR